MKNESAVGQEIAEFVVGQDLQLTIKPIGIIRTDMRLKFDTPHQPKNAVEQHNIIELFSQNNFEQALQDLIGFDRVWLVWWFHKNTTWRPRVLPPRGESKKRGVFATRSPHRPNPIGLSAVPLLGIKGRRIIVGNTDLVDGTPILDIKPYIRTVDSFPDAKLGWLETVENQYQGTPKFSVLIRELAQVQLTWLRVQWHIDFMARAEELLSNDPTPHRTRRISKVNRQGDEARTIFRLGCGAWRVFFSIIDTVVQIESIGSGYPDRVLSNPLYEVIPDREAQIAFNKNFTVP